MTTTDTRRESKREQRRRENRERHWGGQPQPAATSGDAPKRQREPFASQAAWLAGSSGSAATLTAAGAAFGPAGVLAAGAVGAAGVGTAAAVRRFAPGTAEKVGLRKPNRDRSGQGHDRRGPGRNRGRDGSGAGRDGGRRGPGLGRRAAGHGPGGAGSGSGPGRGGLLGRVAGRKGGPGVRNEAGQSGPGRGGGRGRGGGLGRKLADAVAGRKHRGDGTGRGRNRGSAGTGPGRGSGRNGSGAGRDGKRGGLLGRLAGRNRSGSGSGGGRGRGGGKGGGILRGGFGGPGRGRGGSGPGRGKGGGSGSGGPRGRGKGGGNTRTGGNGRGKSRRKSNWAGRVGGFLGGLVDGKDRKWARGGGVFDADSHSQPRRKPDKPATPTVEQERSSFWASFKPAGNTGSSTPVTPKTSAKSGGGASTTKGGFTMPNPFNNLDEAFASQPAPQINVATDLLDVLDNQPKLYEGFAAMLDRTHAAVSEQIHVDPVYDEMHALIKRGNGIQSELNQNATLAVRAKHAEDIAAIQNNDPRKNKWDPSLNAAFRQ